MTSAGPRPLRDDKWNRNDREGGATIAKTSEEDIGRIVLDCAMMVHRALGPGLLESAYESCLAYELLETGLKIERQLTLSLRYKGLAITTGYRIDLLVANLVVIEVKAIEKVSDVHRAQLLSYLKLGGWRLGYLLQLQCRDDEGWRTTDGQWTVIRRDRRGFCDVRLS